MTKYLHHTVFTVELQLEIIGAVLQGKGFRELGREGPSEARAKSKLVLEAVFRDHHLCSSG